MAMDTRGYKNLLRKQTGKAVRPVRYDGYVNLINRYGTSKDIDEQYFFSPEPDVPDDELELFYEGNGLFAKIIDTPAEEAVKHGFELEDLNDDEIKNFYESALDELDWEEVCMTCIKWARLYGGSLAVMLINDGRGLEEPLDWDSIESIDDIVVYDRSLIVPDQSSIYKYEKDNPFGTRGSRLGTPEWYEINSTNGNFRVHDSRVLAFRNGVLPQRATHQNYQLWGIPEYVRINRAIRNAEVAHESAPKMLSKSVQPVYKMKNLSELLATTDGEDKVLRRLRLIDMARSFLNSITIDQEGEDYSFASFAFNGVDQVITSSCNWLSALTSIPQTILFGRSPAGMNATGDADLENYYNYVERIQKRMVRSNLRYLLSVIFTAGLHTGEIDHIPEFSIKFSPLWSMTESEQVALDLQKAQVESARAQTASTYIQNQVIDPGEVRKSLAESDEFDIETMLDDYTEEELEENAPKGEEGGMPGEGGLPGMPPMGGAPDGGGMLPMGGDPGSGQEAPAQPAQAASEPVSESGEEGYALQGNSPETAPEATKLPQDQLEEDPDHEDAENMDDEDEGADKIISRHGKPDYEAPVPAGEASSWLVQDLDPLMTNNPDTSSPDWTDDEIKRRIRSVGVLVVDQFGKILTGVRKGGSGENYGLLGGPGGHVEPGESLEDAAIRETYEEFGIVPKDLMFISLGRYEEDSGMIPAIFLCTEWAGRIYPVDGEMENIRFRTIDDIETHKLFGPFESSLEILEKELTSEDEDGNIVMDEFVESDHPRDEDGRFSKNSTSGAKSASPSGGKSSTKYAEIDDDDEEYNPDLDGPGEEAKREKEHAISYYKAVRRRHGDVKKIARNTGFPEQVIDRIREHVFMKKHDLGDDKMKRFSPDYDMAQSWQRLVKGKNIQPHDVTLLKHEQKEYELMDSGLSQDKAHALATREFDYQGEVEKYNGKSQKHNKDT